MIEETRKYIFKSSAKNRKWHFFRINKKPLINKINRIGDKCPPWAVSDRTNVDFDTKPRTLINWYLFIRYELLVRLRGSDNELIIH